MKELLSPLLVAFAATTVCAQTTVKIVGVDQGRKAFRGVILVENHPQGGLAVAFAAEPEASGAQWALGGRAKSGWNASGGLVCDLRPRLGAVGALERAEKAAPTRLVLVRDARSGSYSGKLSGPERVAWFREERSTPTPTSGLPTRRGYVLVTVDTSLRGGFSDGIRDRSMVLPMQIRLPRGRVYLYSIWGRVIGVVDLDRYRREGRIARGICYRQDMRSPLHNNRLGQTNYLCQVTLGPRPEPVTRKNYVLAEVITPTATGVSTQTWGRVDARGDGVRFVLTADARVYSNDAAGTLRKAGSYVARGSHVRYAPGREVLRRQDGKTFVFVELLDLVQARP
jgi:hypothetical protein